MLLVATAELGETACLATLNRAVGEREFGGPRGGGPRVDDAVPGLTTAN